MAFGVYPKLTRDYILERITQEQIMEKYLGIPVTIGNLVISPLRNDRHPTCAFYYNKYGRLRFRDMSGHFWGDCFDVVAYRLGVDSKDKRGFGFIMETIAKDFRIHKYENVDAVAKYEKITKAYFEKRKKATTQFKIKFREFDYNDEKYWKQFNINIPLLKYGHVYAADEIYVSKNNLPFISIYNYKYTDPAYCYYGGKNKEGIQRWKIYYPMRKAQGESGFHLNISFLEGAHMITPGRFCIITKSLKDVLTFRSIGLQAIAPPAESVLITPNQFLWLKNQFDYIVSCMDFDLAGVSAANKMRKQYRIEPFFFTDGRFGTHDYKAKDVSDFVKLRGVGHYKNHIDNIYSKYESLFRRYDKELYKQLKFIQ